MNRTETSVRDVHLEDFSCSCFSIVYDVYNVNGPSSYLQKSNGCYQLPTVPACESAATHEDTAFHVRQRLFGEAAVVETLLGSWVHSQIGKKTPGRSHLCHSCDHMPPVASRTVGRFPKIQASLNHPYHFRIYDFSLSIQLLGYP